MLNLPLYMAMVALLFETNIRDTGLSLTSLGPVIFAITLILTISSPLKSITFAVIVMVLFVLGSGFIIWTPGITGSSSSANSRTTHGASVGSVRVKPNIPPLFMSP